LSGKGGGNVAVPFLLFFPTTNTRPRLNFSHLPCLGRLLMSCMRNMGLRYRVSNREKYARIYLKIEISW